MKVLLVNIYALNNDGAKFFTNLIGKIDAFSPHYVLIGGDLNLALNPLVDCEGSIMNNEKAAQTLRTFITSKDLVDCFRFFHEDQNGFTWRRLKP